MAAKKNHSQAQKAVTEKKKTQDTKNSKKNPVTVKPSRLTVIEGADSMHPLLQSYYDFSVLMHISPALQKKRIQKRNAPRLAERFFAEWIPMEEKYRAAFSIQEQCSLVIFVEE